MSDQNMPHFAVLLILTTIAASVCGFVSGLKSGKQEMERAAVKSGHAYYATNSDGEPVFAWKP